MSTELATTNGDGTITTIEHSAPAMDLTSMQRWAKVFIESGLFKGTTNAAQRADIAKAVVKIQYGQELGLPPFAAMNGIDIIDGRPAPGAGLIAALIKRDPRYNYRVLEASAKGVTIEWTEDGQVVGETSFTVEDAERAGLTKKFNWKSYPEDMCFARALTRGARRFCGDVFLGSVYVAEELEPVEKPQNFGGGHDALPAEDDSTESEDQVIDVDVAEVQPEPIADSDSDATDSEEERPISAGDIAVMIRTAGDVTTLTPLWRSIHDEDVPEGSRRSLSASWATAVCEVGTADQLNRIIDKLIGEFSADENASSVVDLLSSAAEAKLAEAA